MVNKECFGKGKNIELKREIPGNQYYKCNEGSEGYKEGYKEGYRIGTWKI